MEARQLTTTARYLEIDKEEFSTRLSRTTSPVMRNPIGTLRLQTRLLAREQGGMTEFSSQAI